MEKSRNILEAVILNLLKILVLIMPIFFLPWTKSVAGMDDFSKQYLLWLFVPALLGLFLYRIYRYKGEILFNAKTLILIVPYLSIALLAALNSQDAFSSFFGGNEHVSQPFASLLMLAVFYFLITNIVRSSERIESINKFFIHSLSVVVFASVFLLALFWTGVIGADSWLAKIFEDGTGIIEDLSVFIAVSVMPLLAVLARGDAGAEQKQTRPLIKITAILSLLLLAVINFLPAWLCLAAGLIVFAYCQYLYKKHKTPKAGGNLPKTFWFKNLNYWHASFILTAVIFIGAGIYTGADAGIKRQLSPKFILDYGNSWQIARSAVSDKPWLGYGPESFARAFSFYRPADLNSTPYWHIRFNASAANFLEIMATTGILGMISFALIIGVFLHLIFSIGKILPNKAVNNKQALQYMGIISALAAVIAAQIIYAQNTVLWFIFWLLAGLATSVWYLLGGKMKVLKTDIFSNKHIALAASLLAVAGFTGWLVLAGNQAKYWLAETGYAAGQNDPAKMERSASLIPQKYYYRTGLAKYYLRQALALANNTASIEDANLVRDTLNKSIVWAKQAVATAPYSVSANETLGMIYREAGNLALDSASLSAQFFSAAASLEPTNPILYTEAGKAYYQAGSLAEARVNLEKARELKSDYFDASFSLSKVYIDLEKYYDALGILDELAKYYQDNKVYNIYYEQGRAFYNMKNYSQAAEKFKAVTKLVPDHANSLYSLALIAEETGDKQGAVKYYERVLELNPGILAIEEKIKELSE